jgi:hypothetical protein
MAIIAITTNNSIKVNACRDRRRNVLIEISLETKGESGIWLAYFVKIPNFLRFQGLFE